MKELIPSIPEDNVIALHREARGLHGLNKEKLKIFRYQLNTNSPSLFSTHPLTLKEFTTLNNTCREYHDIYKTPAFIYAYSDAHGCAPSFTLDTASPQIAAHIKNNLPFESHSSPLMQFLLEQQALRQLFKEAWLPISRS